MAKSENQYKITGFNPIIVRLIPTKSGNKKQGFKYLENEKIVVDLRSCKIPRGSTTFLLDFDPLSSEA